MPTPIFSTRLPPDHHELFRRLAARAKSDPAFVVRLVALCDGADIEDQAKAHRPDEDAEMLRSRLDRLERTVVRLSDRVDRLWIAGSSKIAVNAPLTPVEQASDAAAVDAPSTPVRQGKRGAGNRPRKKGLKP